jgi:signal transduction histidine kinase
MRTRILLVEDDATLREMLAELLDLNGFEVAAATQGAEALGLLTEQPPDLVLSDVAMPVMDGFALVRVLRERPETRNLPIILLSARTEREQVRQGMDLGADDYITKPFTTDELLRAIQVRLDQKALIDELDAFAHTVAYSLRSILGPVLDGAELLAEAGDSLDESRRDQTARRILAHARGIDRVIDELLLLSKLRQAVLICEPVHMDQVVAKVLGRLAAPIRDAAATVDTAANWPLAWGHPAWIEEIWINYITNAIQYGGNPPRISLGGEQLSDQTVRFWVRDNGRGLTVEEQARLFVPFTRLGHGRNAGHGLGLSVVGRIVDRLGGRVGVESVLGGGSLFSFTLPAVQPGRRTLLPGDYRSQRP